MHGMEYFFDSLKIQSFHIWSFNPTEVADKRYFTALLLPFLYQSLFILIYIYIYFLLEFQ